MRAPHVLIVDDDDELLTALARALTARQCIVRTSGPLGVTTLVRTFRPDVIIIDFEMAALDGDRLAYLIRTTYGNDIPIIFHSGRDPSIVQLSVTRIPNSSFVPKPASPESLHAAICSVMREIRPGATPIH